MKFSTSIEYAVHGLIYLAGMQPGGLALTKDIASATRLPEPYLRKVFQQLCRSAIVDSQKGARGGYRLARDPDSISLRDVVESIDGSLPTYTCLRNQRGCDFQAPCPVHHVFEEATQKMADVLEETSIGSLASQISRHEPMVGWLQVPV